MYPNQPPQAPPPQTPLPTPTPPPLPSDYLNQIAPQAPKRSVFRLGIKQLVLIGAVLVILVIALSVIVSSITNHNRDPLEHLAARLAATQTIADNAQVNLKSSELRSLNSNLKLYLTNTNRDIATPLMAVGLNTKKLSKNIVAAESTTALAARLEDARLNAVYDRTYAREMAYQLATLMTLMNQIYNSTGNTQLKTFLKTAYTNLEPTQASFANFTTTN